MPEFLKNDGSCSDFLHHVSASRSKQTWFNDVAFYDVTFHDVAFYDVTFNDVTFNDVTFNDVTFNDVTFTMLRRCVFWV